METKMTTSKFAFLRSQVRAIQAATKAGQIDFEGYAKRVGAEIKTCRYNELQGIWCDCLAYIDGRLIVTEQNLQYFPAKIRYFFRYPEE